LFPGVSIWASFAERAARQSRGDDQGPMNCCSSSRSQAQRGPCGCRFPAYVVSSSSCREPTMHRCPALGTGFRALLLVLATGCVLAGPGRCPAEVSEQRRSAIVSAVETARSAIVNIHGEKLVDAAATDSRPGEGKRRVNGMGT